MAVPVPAGDSTITFRFKAAGLKTGRIASVCGITILIGYVAIDYYRRKKRGEDVKIPVIGHFMKSSGAKK